MARLQLSSPAKERRKAAGNFPKCIVEGKAAGLRYDKSVGCISSMLMATVVMAGAGDVHQDKPYRRNTTDGGEENLKP